MQKQRPDTRQGPIEAVGDLARTHGHHALRVAGVGPGSQPGLRVVNTNQIATQIVAVCAKINHK